MRISKLAPSNHIQGRWLCHLEDGSILRITENEIVAFGLCSRLELPPERLGELEQAARAAAVRDKAMDLLAARPLSRKELVDKLTARPRNKDKEPIADRETAQAAADRLEELGYLNDEAYAHTVADHYAAKGWGPSRIKDELYRRGVPREYWDSALEELDAPDDAIDVFLQKKLRGADLTDPKTYQRVANALARRGFRWEDIKEGLRRYGGAMEDEF